MKILVTGADGFIGSHLVERLLRNGYEVKAFCIYNSSGSHGWLDTLPQNIKENIEIVLGDIRDFDKVKESMSYLVCSETKKKRPLLSYFHYCQQHMANGTRH